VLSNRLTANIPSKVPIALTDAGLPASSVAAFLAEVAVNPESAFKTVPGISAAIAKAGVRAYQEASSQAYGTVFLTTIAFSVISFLLACIAPNVNHLLTNAVSVNIHERNSDKTVGTHTKHEVVEQEHQHAV
jgi:hypothetical protein